MAIHVRNLHSLMFLMREQYLLIDTLLKWIFSKNEIENFERNLTMSEI